MMKLFWTPASPFVRKVMVTAIELGLDDRIDIHPTYWPHEWGSRTVAFDPPFVAANPIGRIPALVTEEGVALPESNWICEYLGTLNPAITLLPSQGSERWTVRRALALADGALEAMIARRAESLRPNKERSSDFASKQSDRTLRCLATLERELDALQGPLTLAQITSAVACGYVDFRYPEDAWRGACPRLAGWYDGFAARPSMLRTTPAETPQRAGT